MVTAANSVMAHLCRADMDNELTIRSLTSEDRADAVAVINSAAEWYREFLPPLELQSPEMTEDDWAAEANRMTWYGAFDADELVAVMGLEYVQDVALFRHAYVLPRCQRRGVALALHQHLERRLADVNRIVVGTYAANYKARNFLEKIGYRLSPDSSAVLRTYYNIPEDRLQSSVTYEKRVS